MEYKKKDLGSYNLHIIKTNKFKTVTLKVVFKNVIKKEDITKRNILSDILLQSSKNYQSKRDLIIKAEELYALDIYNHTERIGNYISTSFILQVLNDKYTESENLEKSIEHLSEIIFNPDIESDAFKEDKLDIVKKNCKDALETIKEDTTTYSTIRMNEAYKKDSPISYRIIGYEEDLNKIDTKNLYDYYQNMITNDFVDIFIVGEIEEEKILSIIKKNFKFRKLKKKKIPYEIENNTYRKRKLYAKETIETSQSKLVIACPVSKMKPYEKNYPLVLGNIILGMGSDSKLFKTVREKYSLCYVIYSSLSKLDNLITIQAGIDKKDYKKTVEVITEEIDKIKRGRITEKEIKIAKELYSSSIESIEENPLHLITAYQTEEIIGFENYKERANIMNKVKKGQIIKAIKKVHMDTIFLLEGDIK